MLFSLGDTASNGGPKKTFGVMGAYGTFRDASGSAGRSVIGVLLGLRAATRVSKLR